MRRNFAASTTVQAVIARTLAGDNAWAFAQKRWGGASGPAAMIQKAGVADTASGDFGTRTPDSEFFASVFDASPFAQGAWRQVGFNRRLLRVTAKTAGVWVGESKGIPASRPTIAASSLAPKKCGAIVIETQEALEDPLSEVLFESELRGAAVSALVVALLDPSNAGDAATPKSITHSSVATNVTGTSEPATDVAAAIEAFDGDLSQAIWLLDPVSAAQLALARDAGGNHAFPKIGVRGGEIVGAPAYVFLDIPRDTNGGVIALVDPSGIAYAFDSVLIERATHGAIEADTVPTGASDTPVAASAHLISLFQNDLCALKVTATANWEVQRSGGVVAIMGVNYPTEAA